MADLLKPVLRLGFLICLLATILLWIFFSGGTTPRDDLVESVLEMRDGFNHQRAGAVLRHCSEDFEESVYSLDASRFRMALVRIFFSQRDPQDQSFLWRAEVSEEDIQVLLEDGAEDASTATVSAVIRFYHQKKPAAGPRWELQIDADALLEEDRHWRFIGASFRTISGRMPF